MWKWMSCIHTKLKKKIYITLKGIKLPSLHQEMETVDFVAWH